MLKSIFSGKLQLLLASCCLKTLYHNKVIIIALLFLQSWDWYCCR